MTDAVNGVQNFKTWLAGQSDDVKAKPKSEARELFRQAKADYKKGLELERQSAVDRAERNGQSAAEFAGQEDYETNAPLYRNRKARVELRQQTREELQALGNKLAATIDDEAEREKFLKKYNRSIDKQAKAYVKNEAIADRVTHTQLYETRDEVRAARRAAGDAADDFRFKKLPGAITDADNEVMQNNIAEHDGDIEAAVKNELYETVGIDNKLNKGVEREAASANLGVSKNQAGTAARRAGFGVESRVQIGDILKPLAVGAGAGLASSAIPVLVDFVSEVHITAENFTGTIDSVKEAEVKVHPWKSGLAGGAAAAALSALFATTGSNEENLLRGLTPEEAARRPDKLGKEGNNFRTLVEYMNQEYGSEETAKMLQDAASGEHAIPTMNSREAASLLVAMAHKKEQPEVKPDTPEQPVKPEQPINQEQPQQPVKPPVEEPNKPPVQPEPQKQEPVNVIVQNGESFAAIAKKYGIDVKDLIALNKDKIHGHKDCNGKVHRYFRAGETITLPAGANEEAVAKNNETTAKAEAEKYRKAVTSEKSVKKFADDDCPPNTKAAGPEVEKLVRQYKDEQAKKGYIAEAQQRLAEAGFAVDPKELEGKTLDEQVNILAQKEIDAENAAKAKAAAAERQIKGAPEFLYEPNDQLKQRFPNFRTIQ